MGHYELLGVPETADIAEIRSAYRKLALKLHPDWNPGNKEIAERFAKISAAYQVLLDHRTREVYDRERRRTVPRPVRRGYNTTSVQGVFRTGPIPVRMFGGSHFQAGPIPVVQISGTETVVINNVQMPGVRIFIKKNR